MAGVTKEEIARAKELDLLTYFKLVEPSNLKLVGKEYRHKVHSSLTISKDSLWCWHCIGLRGRTALKYLIDVEKVPLSCFLITYFLVIIEFDQNP